MEVLISRDTNINSIANINLAASLRLWDISLIQFIKKGSRGKEMIDKIYNYIMIRADDEGILRWCV